MEDGDSTSGDDDLEDSHCANLPSYIIKDACNKEDFKIYGVYEYKIERLDCDSDIYRDEIYDLHSMCAVAKEIKERYKVEEGSVMDNLWRNGVLIEKVGDTTISRFKIP